MKRSHEKKAASWREIFAAWTASGMTAVGFCRSRDIPVPGFYYWKRRLGVPGKRQARAADGSRADMADMFWRIAGDEGGTGVTVIVGAYRLELSENFSVATLRRALAALAGPNGK
jgi:hypothetical protein